MDMLLFKDPPPLYRNAPFWSWNDRLDPEELKRQIDEMADKGWGSYFMHSRVGLVTGYLSPQWMELIRTCAEHAKKTNTHAWLYDEDKWPSGFGGGEVPKQEDYRSRALVLLRKEEITSYDTVLADTEQWGESFYICKRVSSLGNAWFNGACYADLMNPGAVKAFIDSTHERYKEECGQYFGKEIPGIFTDEPCYLMEKLYNVPVVPWSDFLPDFFAALKGYKINDHLEQLFFDTKDFRKIRYDFYDACTRLFLQSFAGQYYHWCSQNNLKMTGHQMGEETLVSQTKSCGAVMPNYEFMHWPGIDKLGKYLDQIVTVKQATSVADQLGKERCLSESFGCVGQQVSFFHRKWLADWQAVLGISFVNSHLSLYSMRGERKRDHPANFYYQQAWWKDEKKFGDYIGRLSYAATIGKRDVDILVLHPIASVWSEYSPLHKNNNYSKSNSCGNESETYDKPFSELSRMLIAYKLDFHYGDEILIEKHGRVENGKFIIGDHSYSTVVVPPSSTLRSRTLQLLQQFASEAGIHRIIAIAPCAERIDGLKEDVPILRDVVKAASLVIAVEKLDTMYTNRVRVTDINTGENAEKVICHHRVAGNGRYTLLANTDEQRTVRTLISLPGISVPIVLDLASGKTSGIPYHIIGERTELAVKFLPAGSILLYIPKDPVSISDILYTWDSGVEVDSRQELILRASDFKIRNLEPNVLPINDVSLYLNGRMVLYNKPVSLAWRNWFYKAPDETPFKAEYRFDIAVIPEGEIFAAIEAAENLDMITLNRKAIEPLKERGELGCFDPSKSWKDINFTRVPLTGMLVKGTNILTLEGRKINNITDDGSNSRVVEPENHFPTEVETVYIIGDFTVQSEDRINFHISNCKEKIWSKDLTLSGYPFYAGCTEFKCSFTMNEKPTVNLYLKLNDVEAASVSLYVNSIYVDVKYWSPYLFKISSFLQEGINEIKFVATTTLFNLMGPNRISNILNSNYVNPKTFINMSSHTDKYTLIPFGIGSFDIIEFVAR